MPRHAARLVLGRSARATLPLKPRGFSTTPRRLDEDDASKPTRRERSVAAASALGAMSRPSEPTHTSPERKAQVLDARRLGANRPTIVVRPANLGAKPNVISVQGLPQRPGGASGSFVRRVVFDDDRGRRAPPQGNAAPTGRFVGRSAGLGGPRPSQPYNGSGGRFQARAGGGGAARGGFGGARGGGGMRGRPKGAKKARSDSDKKKDEDGRNNGGMSAMSEEVKTYIREQEVGKLRAYTPSTTLESLVGWGPAVATATALGQADITMRNVRIMGGGRANVEGEQSFKINEVKNWLARNKPIFFSSIEQKKAVMETLSHEKKEKVIQANMDATVMEIQKKAGNNWGAFVEAFKAWAANMPSTELGKKLVKSVGEHATPETWLRATAEHKANANLQALAEGYKTQNTKTTREAIAKYALKGEHPEVKYAEDVWGKLAMYHAHGSTYRISDGEKFDEKMRKLIRVPMAGKAAPKAQARA